MGVSQTRRRFLLLGDPSPAAGVRYERKARVSDRCFAQRAILCRSCGEHCEPQAIRFRLSPGGRSLPVIDDDRCNACNECVRVCPAQAVSLRVVELATA